MDAEPRMLLDDVGVDSWRLVHLHPTECSGLAAAEVLQRLGG